MVKGKGIVKKHKCPASSGGKGCDNKKIHKNKRYFSRESNPGRIPYKAAVMATRFTIR